MRGCMSIFAGGYVESAARTYPTIHERLEHLHHVPSSCFVTLSQPLAKTNVEEIDR